MLLILLDFVELALFQKCKLFRNGVDIKMPDFSLEARARSNGFNAICGVDEVGRGSWAGPVVSAAVIVDEARLPIALINKIDDSKKLRKAVRNEIYFAIKPFINWQIGIVSAQEIDETNISAATMLSMKKAVLGLTENTDFVLIDGVSKPEFSALKSESVIKGDTKSISIAVASIIAKVSRDRMMSDMSEQFPGYGWCRNAGYGTKEHLSSLKVLGLTPEHRKSFAPMRNM